MTFSKLDKKIIATAMEQFGCNDRESAVYLEILQIGPSSVQQVARRLQSNRITIHSTIKQLVEKGLLFESLEGVRRKIEAHDPSVFGRLAAEKAFSIKLLEQSADELQKILADKIPHNIGSQKVEFHEGIDSYKRMLMRTLEAKGEFLAIINTQLFAELLGRSYLLNFFKKRAELGIHSRLILPPVEFVKVINQRAKELKVQVRTIPSKFIWEAGVISWNDCLSIKSFSEKHLSCTIIENREVSNLFRQVIFETLWASAARTG